MKKNKIIFSLFLIVFGVIARFFVNRAFLIPNFEPVTSLFFTAGSLLGGFLGMAVSLLTIFISDMFFKNSAVFLFTWSAFALIGLFGNFVKKGNHYPLKITAGTVLSVLFFYLWTNFGWWFLSNSYAMSLTGLLNCYTAALPFLKNQLVSALIFAPLFSVVFSLVKDLLEERKVNQEKENVLSMLKMQ